MLMYSLDNSLERFPNSIGITSYLVQRLDSFAASQIEFYWPQLCYLLITRPSASVALENYILRKSQEDLHLAIIVRFTFSFKRQGLYLAALADRRHYGTCNHRCMTFRLPLSPLRARERRQQIPSSRRLSSKFAIACPTVSKLSFLQTRPRQLQSSNPLRSRQLRDQNRSCPNSLRGMVLGNRNSIRRFIL